MLVTVTRDVLEELHEAACKARPNEACGLLLGDSEQIDQVVQTSNVHATPETHFEIDPKALIDAYRVEREGGRKLMGYFHSHPTSDAHPSETDRAMAAHDGKIWAIVAGDEVSFWRDDPAGFHALSHKVVGG